MVKEKEDRSISMSEFEECEFDNDPELEEKPTDSDGDDCENCELQKTFSKTYSIVAEKAVNLCGDYILHLSCTDEPITKICVGLSNNNCEIYSFSNSQITKDINLEIHCSQIINVKFGNDNNTLFTGFSDCIKLWDLRCPCKAVLVFKDDCDENDDQKPLLDFDVSPNNRLLCGSTELHKGDAFLLFWDIRKKDQLGGYWETHTDDITKVLFHHTDNNKLASGSTDGLVNVYNLEETNEDDALFNTLNTDSSVEQILWYSTDDHDSICCVTHTTDVQLWDVDDATTYNTFTRADITESIKRKSPSHCYIANMHLDNSDSVFLLAGSNWNKGECVRGINIENNENLIPNFNLENNKQRIRTSWYNKHNDTLITGGEQGILSVWQDSKEMTMDDKKNPLKIQKKTKTRKLVKPY